MKNKYIFTPGPVLMGKEILDIGAQQTPYFRNEEFSQTLLECEKNLLRLLNAPKNSRVIFLTASGTAAMESAVANLIADDDKTVVINGGGFGERFVDICNIYEKENIVYTPKDNITDTSTLPHNVDNLLINAHETSIGRLYDIESIGNFCKEHTILNIVDAISMFLTDELDMQKFNIDALLLSSQKALALPPGMSFVILNEKAQAKLQNVRSLYFNYKLYLKDGTRGQTPFTPAVTIILQLQKRLEQLLSFGIENEIQKAQKIASYFRESIKKLPLKAYSEYMPNAMTTLSPTDGKKASQIVKDLDKIYNIVVTPNGGALQEKIFRVSHMGAMSIEYTDILIDALFDYYGEER